MSVVLTPVEIGVMFYKIIKYINSNYSVKEIFKMICPH